MIVFVLLFSYQNLSKLCSNSSRSNNNRNPVVNVIDTNNNTPDMIHTHIQKSVSCSLDAAGAKNKKISKKNKLQKEEILKATFIILPPNDIFIITCNKFIVNSSEQKRVTCCS